MKFLQLSVLSLAVSLAFSACKKDENKPSLNIPSAYDGSNFEANTTTERALVTQLSALTSIMQKGRTKSNTVEKSKLDSAFTAGNPSLASIITSYYKGRIEGTGGWFDELAKASGDTFLFPVAGVPVGDGGVLGGYLFDENGLELEQLVEKGQFGATHYNHAVSLLSGTITPATVDKLIAIFGATPSFSNSGSNKVDPNIRDRASANYAARRSKGADNNSLYAQMKANFIKLQAAVKGGEAFNKERDEAVAALKLTWEKIIAATVINYCHSTTSTLSNSNLTDAQKGSGLHAYGECVGFIHGWLTIPQAHKKITDTQIEEILTLLNAPRNGTPTSYKFVTDGANELPKLQQIIDKLQTIYGFSPQDIIDFKSNWVNVEGR